MINTILSLRAFLEKATETSPGLLRYLSKLAFTPIKLLSRNYPYKTLNSQRDVELSHLASLPEDGSFSVSLTSFPARINKVWMTLWSVWNQTVLPDRVFLCLTKQEFPNEMNDMPQEIKAFVGKGLEIIFTEDNLYPHNKYYYTLSHVNDKDVITIDDDFVYINDTFQRLLALRDNNPNCICANRVQRIRKSGDDFLSYEEWPLVHGEAKGHDLVALGYAGVLYPKSFRPQSLFNIANIKELSLRADDLWLKAIEICEGYPVATGKYFAYPYPIPSTQVVALQHSNNNKSNPQNDVQWKKLNERMDITHKLFI